MAKYVNSRGLKRAFAGFWEATRAYIDDVFRIFTAAIKEVKEKINLKQDILGFWGEYNKDTNAVATKGAVEGITGLTENLKTTARDTLVDAVNEVKDTIDNDRKEVYIQVKDKQNMTVISQEGYDFLEEQGLVVEDTMYLIIEDEE